MSYQQFVDSLTQQAPPEDAELALRALWFDANGRSDSAMRAAQSDASHFGQRVLAYLHRKAGDGDNAHLWYWRSGAPPWTGSPESEWEDIVKSVLAERVVANAYT
jgi:hypothetical protein